MPFAEEANKRVNERQKIEETIKQAIRERIIEYTEMPGWPHNRAHFGGSTEFERLLIDSGWSKATSIDNLLFDEVAQAVSFIVDFLKKEGFQVETRCDAYGINFTITWEKN